MFRKKSIGEKVFDIFNYLLLTFIMIVTVYPMLHVVFSSFSDPRRLMQHRGILLRPLGFTLRGYQLVFMNPNILVGYKNTFFYVVFGTALNIIMTSLGAYALSRRELFWKNTIMMFIVFTMFFSGGLIPWYLVVRRLGLLNTRMAMILPSAMSTWNLIIMRTSFASIPVSLEESAKLDGANDFTILLRIILPLSLPVIAVMTLFYSVGHWNAWFNAMVLIRDRALYPLQLFLREILITDTTENMMKDPMSSEGDIYRGLVKYCTIIVATVPILFAYPFLQKYFVKGVMIGAIKG